ncbi:nuclear transport factor 2 family protein [Streptomyces sp. NPDC088766]|uniref:nuclear transport factor 2 family protein n=1 Tax=Streptomyces sp. NPDC088766 TaxID=3365893 RepID=UPI00380F8E75
MAEHPHSALVRRGFEVFSRRDTDTLRELAAKDATHHVPGVHPLPGDFEGQGAISDMCRRFGECVEDIDRSDDFWS